MLTKKEFEKYKKENIYKFLYNGNDNDTFGFITSKKEYDKIVNNEKKDYYKTQKYSNISNHKKEIVGVIILKN